MINSGKEEEEKTNLLKVSQLLKEGFHQVLLKCDWLNAFLSFHLLQQQGTITSIQYGAKIRQHLK